MAFRPFQESQLSLGNLQDEMNRMFQRVWHAGVSTGPFDGQEWGPALDLYEHPDHYTLYAEIPGVCGESIELDYLDHTLSIRGSKSKPSAECEDARTVRSERRFGTFCRTVELGRGIDVDKMTASCRNGVLLVTIPKAESSRPKSIKVEVKED